MPTSSQNGGLHVSFVGLPLLGGFQAKFEGPMLLETIKFLHWASSYIRQGEHEEVLAKAKEEQEWKEVEGGG